MYGIRDIIAKKRDGRELCWEEIDYFIKGCTSGTINDAQTSAMLMACCIQKLGDVELELMMKSMMFSGQLLSWPSEWRDKMASLQSLGSTGKKAKLILAPVMAACGLKFPILSRSGPDEFGGILSKLSTIPGFDGVGKTIEDVHVLLSDVGCCVVEQPRQVAPAERIIQDVAEMISVGKSFKEACMVARVGALKLTAIIVDIPYGPGELVKTKSEAMEMARTMNELNKIMSIKCHIVVTCVDHPIGHMIGSTVEIVEAIQCFHGSAPSDLKELVCKLGAHVLREAGVVKDLPAGEKMVDKKLKDGSARKKFGQMLHAQGVSRSDVKKLLHQKSDGYEHVWFVLPSARLYTHLAVSEAGFVHHIDVATCCEVLYELLWAQNNHCGGLQLRTSVGSYLSRGEVWAKIHHNCRALTAYQLSRLKNAIKQKLELPLAELKVKMEEVTTI